MKVVIGKFVPDIDDYQEKTGNSNCQSNNIDERKKFSFPNISDGDFDEVLYHFKVLLYKRLTISGFQFYLNLSRPKTLLIENIAVFVPTDEWIFFEGMGRKKNFNGDRVSVIGHRMFVFGHFFSSRCFKFIFFCFRIDRKNSTNIGDGYAWGKNTYPT